MDFDVISEINNIEVIAVGNAIREINRLQKTFGKGNWKKCKGIAKVRLRNGNIYNAEIHWYEAHGIGKKETKIKHRL